jgi:Ethanolamine utilization protein EutJ (predicted chaperonin)
VVDVEIMRITKEKQSISGAFDDAEVVRDGASNDAEDTERVEV